MSKINKLIYLIFVNFMLLLLINIYEPIISNAITTATVYLESNKSIIEKELDLDKMMEKVKQTSEKNIYVVTCFSDRMKFMDRR